MAPMNGPFVIMLKQKNATTEMTASKANGTLAILCGGRALRLGRDKGLYAPLQDEPLVVRALRLLGDTYAEILLVVKDAEQADLYQSELSNRVGVRVRIVHDMMLPTNHPSAALCGIITALSVATSPSVTVVPVDQVGVRERFLTKLARFSEDSDRPAAFSVEDEILPFPSMWPRTLLPKLSALRDGGAFSVRGALRDNGVATLAAGPWHADLGYSGNTVSELLDYLGRPLSDNFLRRLHYLRFSLTEACNMSCTYCLPSGFPEWYRHKARLGEADIFTVLAGFRRLGFRKVRFTGGEPTVHPSLMRAISEARRLGFERIAMTTNGALIGDLEPWMDAGLDQLNISLDSLDAKTFQQLTKSKDHDRVMDLIARAIAAEMPLKINTVLMRSRNGNEASTMMDWAIARPLTLRFIELMPTGLNQNFASDERVLNTELMPLLAARGLMPELEAKGVALGGPARVYAKTDAPGRIGLISPLSCNFCGDCNRLRVTSRGGLKLCLFGDHDHPLDLSSAESVEAGVLRLIGAKEERHHLEDGNLGNVATFRTIGG